MTLRYFLQLMEEVAIVVMRLTGQCFQCITIHHPFPENHKQSVMSRRKMTALSLAGDDGLEKDWPIATRPDRNWYSANVIKIERINGTEHWKTKRQGEVYRNWSNFNRFRLPTGWVFFVLK